MNAKLPWKGSPIIMAKIEALIYGQKGKINNYANNQYLAFAGLLHALDTVLQQRTKEKAKLNSETSSQGNPKKALGSRFRNTVNDQDRECLPRPSTTIS